VAPNADGLIEVDATHSETITVAKHPKLIFVPACPYTHDQIPAA
jgi:hypothetical protein